MYNHCLDSDRLDGGHVGLVKLVTSPGNKLHASDEAYLVHVQSLLRFR